MTQFNLPCRGTLRHIFCLLSLSLLAVGCQKGPELGSVKGTVKLEGQPLANATITFTPEPAGRSSMGRTNDMGEYELRYTATSGGALVGPMRVRITTAGEVTDARERTTMQPELLPKRYNEDSELVVDIKPGANTFDFDLKSK